MDWSFSHGIFIVSLCKRSGHFHAHVLCLLHRAFDCTSKWTLPFIESTVSVRDDTKKAQDVFRTDQINAIQKRKKSTTSLFVFPKPLFQKTNNSSSTTWRPHSCSPPHHCQHYPAAIATIYFPSRLHTPYPRPFGPAPSSQAPKVHSLWQLHCVSNTTCTLHPL